MVARTPREGGMVALMTGVPTLGTVGPAGSLRRRSFDRSAAVAEVADAGRTRLREPDAVSARCNWPPTSGRTGTRKRPRVLSYLAPKSGDQRPRLGPPAALPGDVPAECVQPAVRAAAGGSDAGASDPRPQRAQLHAPRSGAFEVRDSRQREGQAGCVRERHRPARSQPAGQVRERGWRLRQACGPSELSRYGHRQAGPGHRLHRSIRVRLLRAKTSPPATPIWMWGRRSSG